MRIAITFLNISLVAITSVQCWSPRPNETDIVADESQMIAFNCFDCYSDKVCIDDQCYCKPDFYWDGSQCQRQSCDSDFKCWKGSDIARSCQLGSCVCYDNYREDWSNGRKCVYSDTNFDIDDNTNVDVWAWLWFPVSSLQSSSGLLWDEEDWCYTPECILKCIALLSWDLNRHNRHYLSLLIFVSDISNTLFEK